MACLKFFGNLRKRFTEENSLSKLEESLDSNQIPDGKIAALIIDMQPDFLDRIEDSEKEVLINSHIEMIGFLSQIRIPTVVLEYHGHGETSEEIMGKIKKIPEHKFITKHNDNGFQGTKLDLKLKEWDIDNLLLMGINATACVQQTAMGALDKGYRIYTARQLIADRGGGIKYLEDGISWYKENGVYFPDFRKLKDKL